jgi:hypothetical protein
MRRTLAVAFTVLAIAACGGGPTSPTDGSQPVPTSLSGEWAIDFVVDSCTGNRQCGHLLRQVQRATLRVIEEGGRVTGVFYIGLASPAVTVSGTKTGRQIEVSGSRPAAFPGVVGSNTFAVPRLRVRFDVETTGEVEYGWSGPPQGDFFGNYVVRGTIVAAQRVAGLPTPQTFSGRWFGNVAIETSQQMTIYELALSESGGRVRGTMMIGGGTVIPVEGSASGDELRLDGRSEQVSSGGRSVYTLLEFTARRDRVDFLSGNLRYRGQYLPNAGEGTDFTADVGLWSVTRR